MRSRNGSYWQKPAQIMQARLRNRRQKKTLDRPRECLGLPGYSLRRLGLQVHSATVLKATAEEECQTQQAGAEESQRGGLRHGRTDELLGAAFASNQGVAVGVNRGEN